MKFWIRHNDGNEYFEANSYKYGREKARKLAARKGLQNAELFAWHQLWQGDPTAGAENNYLSLQWEGWQTECYLD